MPRYIFFLDEINNELKVKNLENMPPSFQLLFTYIHMQYAYYTVALIGKYH